ncbi:MAG: hypothetical protein AB1609_10155 [Bacillota bacterium]
MKAGLVKGTLVTVAAAVLLAGGLVASGSQQNSPPQGAQAASGNRLAEGATLYSEGGRVTVAVSWDGLAQSKGDQLTVAFQVAMDTHSINLDAYDLAKLAVLRNDRGETVHPASWEAPRGGHHRKGVLTFAVPVKFISGTRFLELLVRDVAGVGERVFRWDVGVSS